MTTRRRLIRMAVGLAGAVRCGALRSWAQASEKKAAFEVVSIRPTAGNTMKGFRWAPGPDGYRTEGQSIWHTIMIAYYPQGFQYWKDERLVGAPKWTKEEYYDIEGRVSAEQLAEWQKQTPMQHEMLNAALRTMLEDRCKLVLHQTTVDAPVYALEAGKHGAKLKEAIEGAPEPAGTVKMAGGATMIPFQRGGQQKELPFFHTSMAALAAYLSNAGGRPVQDMTGLNGRYDFVLRKRDEDADAVKDAGTEWILNWDLDGLGLSLRGIKAAVPVLVIDHIERPTAN